MTAVIGILNKKGVALAADSAITWSSQDSDEEKVTKNGNKMIRLSNAVPICVMTTGNADFMQTPWEIIARYYREHRGDIKHETVEACMHDFFRFIADHSLFIDHERVRYNIRKRLNNLFNYVDREIDEKYKQRNKEDVLKAPRGYQKAFESILKDLCKNWLKHGISCQFHDYTLQDFQKYTKEIFDEYIQEQSYEEDDFIKLSPYSRTLLMVLRQPLEEALMTWYSTRQSKAGSHSELVFSGYGKKQDYPSLVSTVVCEGIDSRVNYHTLPEDVICLSDKHPVAICSFAQDDIIRSILHGIHKDFSNAIVNTIYRLFSPSGFAIFDTTDNGIDYITLFDKLGEVKTEDIINNYKKDVIRYIRSNRRKWEKALEDYDLQSMAALAESLIDLTGFHRILTFQQEGVGGPVDVAVISKNDGFVWLNRKSWYHHKDVGGRYGKLGV